MSLMGTLAKVAIGVAVAKGAGSMLNKSRGNAGDGGLFGGQHSPSSGQDTGLEDMMGDVFSGGSGGGGGLGGMLEDLQQQNPQTQNGGIDDLLGGLGGGGGNSGGAIGSLIEQLSGGQAGGAGGAGGLGGLLGGLISAVGGQQAGGQKADTFGSVLNQSMKNRGNPPAPPSQEQEAVAGLMLRAMIQAAKSDGKFDEEEKKKLLDKLGDVSAEEREFVHREMKAPVDIHALAHQVPQGLEQQVYAMSLLGINLDNRQEAQYLHDLASEFRMDKNTVNAIHRKLGAPSIYA